MMKKNQQPLVVMKLMHLKLMLKVVVMMMVKIKQQRQHTDYVCYIHN
jgi:hypothetical protein